MRLIKLTYVFISQMEKLSELVAVAEPDDMQDKAKCEPQAEAEAEAEAKTSFQQSGFEEWGFLGLQIGQDRDAGQQPGEEFQSIDEYRTDSPAASPEKFFGFDSADMIDDQSCSNSQWFNFWI